MFKISFRLPSYYFSRPKMISTLLIKRFPDLNLYIKKTVSYNSSIRKCPLTNYVAKSNSISKTKKKSIYLWLWIFWILPFYYVFIVQCKTSNTRKKFNLFSDYLSWMYGNIFRLLVLKLCMTSNLYWWSMKYEY